MSKRTIQIDKTEDKLILNFLGKLTLYTITDLQKTIDTIELHTTKDIELNLESLEYLDTAGAIFLNNLETYYLNEHKNVYIVASKQEFSSTLALIKKSNVELATQEEIKKESLLTRVGKSFYANYLGLLSFMFFLGKLFATKIHYLSSFKNVRYKEIAFEINESGTKALGIIALTAFLIGLVVAYQSAFQLKIYGANIFVVDMLGISMLRELAPLITAIVIAGRSGSAFTAQIGAMKITEELDAMRTMGFDPYIFLVMPRIIALMIVLPILIFIADMMGIIGGMFVANIDLNITTELFLERFSEVVAIKHLFIGLIKGPFFAFLIASIGIYRGLMVQNDTQSIGFNTTKSVVEAIFAVIVCDAIFSIAFTNLGI
jgi:phospholipid/cholesterol/gamma-HCH transport system permease protein